MFEDNGSRLGWHSINFGTTLTISVYFWLIWCDFNGQNTTKLCFPFKNRNISKWTQTFEQQCTMLKIRKVYVCEYRYWFSLIHLCHRAPAQTHQWVSPLHWLQRLKTTISEMNFCKKESRKKKQLESLWRKNITTVFVLYLTHQPYTLIGQQTSSRNTNIT